ncbi:hypothetical protein B0J14DRAFT_159420 [Halenospora varia]|nr:hypothetical protein B0J14DRAFT_159420 [Halenospora varia]
MIIEATTTTRCWTRREARRLLQNKDQNRSGSSMLYYRNIPSVGFGTLPDSTRSFNCQQTDFLKREFEKDNYPSREYCKTLLRNFPGLGRRPSSLQVFWWFQNQRASVKRMKIDAVPDDFSVQALHSPYGAVHGIGASMQLTLGHSSL